MIDDGDEQPKPAAETEPKEEKPSGKNGAERPEGDAGEVELAEESDIPVKEDDEEDDEEEGEEEDEAKVRPKSRSQRYRERIQRLERDNAELRDMRARAVPRPEDDDKDLVPPKESDFPNDYMAFDRAQRQYENRKIYREERRREFAQRAQESAAQAHQAAVRNYNARLEEYKPKIRDFDKVMQSTGNVEIRNDILRGILKDKKGPLIAYYLARNPDVLDDLHAMDELDAQREIGALGARLRIPAKKTVTKAKPPPATPRGGASPSDADPGKMTHEQYRKWRESQK